MPRVIPWASPAALTVAALLIGCGSAESDGAQESASSSNQSRSAASQASAASEGEATKAAESAAAETSPLLDVYSDEWKEKAPSTFKAKFETDIGDFVVECERAWAPRGTDRFYNLIRLGFFDECRFFRVVPNFVVQFGINGDPEVSAVWSRNNMRDDRVKESNKRGYLTYAKTNAPNSRSTQLFINLKDNPNLDAQGFAPFGRVIEGMDVVDAINPEYGQQANQGQIISRGNSYLKSQFPRMTYVKKATILGD